MMEAIKKVWFVKIISVLIKNYSTIIVNVSMRMLLLISWDRLSLPWAGDAIAKQGDSILL